MKGTVSDFNIQLDEGAILGEDGKRYSFFASEWKEHISPVQGQQVEFAVNQLNQATTIYLCAYSTLANLSQHTTSNNAQLRGEESYGLMDWTLKCLKNYVNFSGRARRKEFWYFILFQIILLIVLSIILTIPVVIGGMSIDATNNIYNLVTLAFLLPNGAVGARRLHDVNRSGWWQLLIFTIIGIIPLFIWLSSNTESATNKWGEAAK